MRAMSLARSGPEHYEIDPGSTVEALQIAIITFE
jgi:hypothetical protein